MNKRNLLLLTTVLMTVQLSAQKMGISRLRQPIVRCYTDKADPSFELWMQKKIEERRTERFVLQSYTLPIVFHVIVDDSTEGSNVSQELIRQQILQINKDYANLSNSPYAIASNTGFQFVLAQKAPSGTTLAEPGIERINLSSRGWTEPGEKGWTRDYITNTIKPATIWNPEKYINVWLVPAMNNGGTGKLLGFSTFPVSSTLEGLNANPAETVTTAGIVIDHETVGSLFRPQTCDQGWGKGKTLSHEMGHYLGLRHIWGDGTCATDYVDDTPTQEDANSGIPVHPKPDACGTADEMFENYMDYSDDEVLSTFTSGQVARMQTVMLNSPRRKNLPQSDVGFVAVTGSNKVAFASCTGIIYTTETATTGTYPRYKDISLNLNAEYQATDAATVTVKVAGTATGTQYQLLTPTLAFAKGDAYKPVVIRLFDNAVADGDRELDVSYTISGSGVQSDTGSQMVTINESDDDDIVFAGDNAIAILSQTFESGNSLGIPTGWNSLVASGYPNFFVAGANGNAGGSGKAAYVTSDRNSKPNTYKKGSDGAAELLSPEINPLQYQSIDTLKFKYRIKGSEDDHAYATYDIGDGSLYFWGQQGLNGSGPYYGTSSVQSASLALAAPGGINGKKFGIAFLWETGTGTSGGDPGFNVDDVSLIATPFHIETAVASSYSYDVVPNTVNKFRSSNNRVVTNIEGVSATISGVSAAVTGAGNAKVSIVYDTLPISRTQKVITLLPVNANATASYTATFYFTKAEMDVWGGSAANLSILKVDNGVDLSGNVNTSNAVLLAPLSVDNRLASEGYITYKVKVTGFGQFMLTDNKAAADPGTAPLVTFANPVGNQMTLYFSGSSTTQTAAILISDMSGKVVYTGQTPASGQKIISTAALARGVYIVKIKTGDRSESYKVLKQ